MFSRSNLIIARALLELAGFAYDHSPRRLEPGGPSACPGVPDFAEAVDGPDSGGFDLCAGGEAAQRRTRP